jgi:hypothetical protein
MNLLMFFLKPKLPLPETRQAEANSPDKASRNPAYRNADPRQRGASRKKNPAPDSG